VADSVWSASLASAAPVATNTQRHTAVVRVTHWITTLCFFALLVSGVELIISHPRFYWGEVGNVRTPSLFDLPIPASRSAVKTGYGFVLPDQNGWSRYLHFQAAWVAVLTGLVYAVYGLFTRHFRKNLFPASADLSWRALSKAILNHVRFKPPGEEEAWSYNVLQRGTYVLVIFVLFPLMIWTGLAMSPDITSAVPAHCHCIRRPAIRANDSFLRLRVSRTLRSGPHCDDLSCRIQETHASHDHGRPNKELV